jgi:hypothetical protein
MPSTPLRPSFTNVLYRRLKAGQSINLVGLRGAGCSRALQDVAELIRNEGGTPILVDLNKYKYNYAGFVEEAQEQLLLSAGNNRSAQKAIEGEYPPVSLILREHQTEHQHIFLLFDHFDALLDDPKQRLPKHFYDDLNSLNNKSNVSICCVTEKPHLQYRVHYKDEEGQLAVTLSWLDLQHLDLPHLLEEEIQAELCRAMKGILGWEEDEGAYIRAISGHLHPIYYIELLKTNFELYPDEYTPKQRNAQVGKQYKERYNNRPKSKTNWDKLLDRLVRLSETVKNLRGK